MANSPKSRTSASCPATISNKSTTSTPTVLKEVGTPVTLHTRTSQELQRHLKRATRAAYEKEKTSEKRRGYLTNLFRKAKKIIAVEDNKKLVVHCSTESDQSTTETELAGNQNSNASTVKGDVLLAKQKAPLVTLQTSQSASMVIPIDHRNGDLGGQPVGSTSDSDDAGGLHAGEVSAEVDALTSINTDTTDPSSQPDAPCIADSSLTTGGSFDLEASISPVRSSPKLRQCFSVPALTVIRHSRFGSDGTLVDSLPPSPTMPPPSPPDSPITVLHVRDGEIEAIQNSRTSLLYEKSNFYNVSPYQVFSAWRDSVVRSVENIKAAQDAEFAERLAKAVAETKASKDEEWSDCLKKAAAQAEAAKDEELEILDRFKESNHSNAIKDLEEDHEQKIQEIEESHATALQDLITRHDEEVSELTRKHGLDARKLEMRRAQGAKEVKKLKGDLSEMEAEKMATEKKLLHMTGQRDALSTALAAIKGQTPPQHITNLEPSQSDQDHNHRHGEVGETTEAMDDDFITITHAGADAANETEVLTIDSGPLQPHQQGQNTQTPTIPNDLYPRLQLAETENAQLREDLERRHEDVRYAIEKADKLRALLEEDPTKADTYADLLIHKEVIEDLQTRLAESYKAAEREKLEAQRLRGQIDVVAAAAQNETLERLLAVKEKKSAWEQNETLLRNLKGNFGKDDFDQAFWAHYESLVEEKEGLEGEVGGYKRERRVLMDEAVELKHQIAELELGSSRDDGGDDDGVQDLRNQVLTLQVDNEIMKAELEFQFAEQTNRKEGQQIPQSLREIQDQVLAGKNREIALLKAQLEGRAVEEGEREGEVRGAEELEVRVDTPRSDYGFF